MTTRFYPSRFWTPQTIAAPTQEDISPVGNAPTVIIKRRIQYQRLAYQPNPDVAEYKWHHSHSQPVRNQAVTRAAAYLVAALAGCVLAPTQPQADTTAWFTTTTAQWHGKTIIFDDYASVPYIAPTAETVTLDKWFAPIAQPRFVKRITGEEGSSFGPPFIGTGDSAQIPAVVSTSLRYDRNIIFDEVAAPPYALTAVSETVTVDKWIGQTNQPTLRKRFSNLDEAFGPTVQPQSNDGMAWWRPLSEPRFVKRITGQEGAAFGPFLDTVTIDRWFAPFGTPRAPKRVPEFPALTYTTAQYPGAATAYNWFVPLNQPVRLSAARIAEFPAVFSPYYPVTVVVETVTLDKWFVAWGTPRAAKRVPEFPALTYTTAQYPGTGAAYNWFVPLNQPTRLSAARVAEFPAIFSPYTPVAAAETVTLDKWFAPLTQPRFVKRITGEEGSFFYGADDPFKAFGWHRPFAEPVRLKRITGQGGAFFFRGDFFTDSYAWRQPLSQPTRRKPNPGLFRSPIVQSFAASLPGTGIGTVQPWPAWSLPTRRITTRWQQFLYVPPLSTIVVNPDAIEGGPADEPERVVCVLAASRVAVVPELDRVATPLPSDTLVASNVFEDMPCPPSGNEAGIPVGGVVTPEEYDVILLEDGGHLLLESGDDILLEQ